MSAQPALNTASRFCRTEKLMLLNDSGKVVLQVVVIPWFELQEG